MRAARLPTELQILLRVLSSEAFRNIRWDGSACADQLILQSVVLLLRQGFTQRGNLYTERPSGLPALQILKSVQFRHPNYCRLRRSFPLWVARCMFGAPNSQPPACNFSQLATRNRRLRRPSIPKTLLQRTTEFLRNALDLDLLVRGRGGGEWRVTSDWFWMHVVTRYFFTWGLSSLCSVIS